MKGLSGPSHRNYLQMAQNQPAAARSNSIHHGEAQPCCSTLNAATDTMVNLYGSPLSPWGLPQLPSSAESSW